MSYQDQLKDPRWLELRQKVLERDRFQCLSCGKIQNIEPHQVHHLDYRPSAQAWEYPLAELATLCNWCHQNTHVYIESLRRLVRQMPPGELEVFVTLCFTRFSDWKERTGNTSRVRYWRECSELLPRSEDVK